MKTDQARILGNLACARSDRRSSSQDATFMAELGLQLHPAFK
jgi:hypothetical protein